tara:strand:+ start:207 stop:932 length:726 start_codon:yes stop_codon:yes gene_type:complete
MPDKVNALLLSAGLGTRLRPLTLKQPKCLVSIAGEPLLGRWLRILERSGVNKVLINTHYLSSQVEKFVHIYKKKSNMIIETVFETKLYGTAGTLMNNKSFFNDSIGILIHADNMCDIDIPTLLKAHKNRKKGCLITMVTFNTDTPETCGIVETDSSDIVIKFHEKSSLFKGYKANGAIYVFEKSLLDFLDNSNKEISDFSNEVIPELLGKIQTWHTNKPFLDIGTLKSLQKARSLWETINK